MRQLRSEGGSYREVAAQLNERGIPAKQGGRWLHSAVKSVLARRERTAG
jgi:hypothetical protein